MTGSAFKAMDFVVGCLSYEKGGGLEEGGLEIGPEGRAADFFFTRLDCAGVAQTHFSRVAILLDRVVMQARAPIWTFPIFMIFCVFFWRRFGLRRRGPNTHLRENVSNCCVLVALFSIKCSGRYNIRKAQF